MTTSLLINPTIHKAAEPAVPEAVLDALAQHVRPGGICLAMLSPDGSLVYHDAADRIFYDRYVVPVLRNPDLANWSLADTIASLDLAAAGVILSENIPGVLLAMSPVVKRRQLQGVLVAAARQERFSASEEVLRLCGKLGLDSEWFVQRAAEVAPFDAPRLTMGMNLLVAMFRDKLRVLGLEQERNNLSTQLSNAYEELTLIEQLSGGMRVNRRATEFFRQACLDVMSVIGVRGMGVALGGNRYNEDPVLYGQLALPAGQIRALADQLVEHLVDRKSVLLINDLAHDKNFAWLSEWATRLIAVPLQRQDEVLGCFFGLDKAGGDFDSVDSKLLTSIANQSAVYLENAMLFGDVHDLMMGLLHSLTSAVDAKDAYTCGHSERVALLARHVAQQAGMPEQDVERTYMAGLLHDVGKIGVPESVLQKAGRLTPEEFDLMKKHPQIGARILDDVKQLEGVVPGVLHHHERFDGRGYPAALAGHDIPVMGRIICLADCLDAMTTNRTYRKALPMEVALNEIRRCSGTQFDPALAEMLLRTTADEYRLMFRQHELRARKLLDLQQTLRRV